MEKKTKRNLFITFFTMAVIGLLALISIPQFAAYRERSVTTLPTQSGKHGDFEHDGFTRERVNQPVITTSPQRQTRLGVDEDEEQKRAISSVEEAVAPRRNDKLNKRVALKRREGDLKKDSDGQATGAYQAQSAQPSTAKKPASAPAEETVVATGNVTTAPVVEDKHLFVKKKVQHKKEGRSEPATTGAVRFAAPLKRSEDRMAEQAASLPSASQPPVPGIDPLSGLKVVNDQKFPDMYFKHYGVNPTIDTEEEPFSTFSADVDTGSYTLARAYLERGVLPNEEAIRVEEFINAFDYGYQAPKEQPFGVSAEAFPSPNRRGYHVLHIGLKGKDVMPENRKPANLVFVIDTSGSMGQENRLGLVKKALGYLVDQLNSDDSVSIVAYGNRAHTVLRPTSGRDKSVIFSAINQLRTNGSTNAQAGIHLGYQMAAQRFVKGAINRVILCSDGVANNGITTSAKGIFNTVRDKTEMGVKLSTIGFGMGNYNDVLMEQLADAGDGSYYYVDKPEEARRVFTENLTGLLQVIAKDVKIQIEFDQKKVARYRLLGYENRALKKEDFRNDKIDAGEIGAGHTVTAIYEVKFIDREGDFGKLRIRYKAPEGGASSLIEKALPFAVVRNDLENVTPPARLSLAVASFAEKLRGSYWVRGVGYDEIIKIIDGLAVSLKERKEVTELRDLMVRAKGLDRRGDRFEHSAPLAMIDFDQVPVLR